MKLIETDSRHEDVVLYAYEIREKYDDWRSSPGPGFFMRQLGDNYYDCWVQSYIGMGNFMWRRAHFSSRVIRR